MGLLRIWTAVVGSALLSVSLSASPVSAQVYYCPEASVGGNGQSCGSPGGRPRPGCDGYGRRYADPEPGPYVDRRNIGGNGPSCGPWGGRPRPGCDEYRRRYDDEPAYYRSRRYRQDVW